MLPALNSFALFCFVLAIALTSFGWPVALTVTLFVQLAMQAVTLWRMTRALGV